jgi:phosphate transport system permease protein
MTEMTQAHSGARVSDSEASAARARVARRYRAETRFKLYGIAAIAFAVAVLVFLIGDIIIKAIPAFTVRSLELAVTVDAASVDPDGNRSADSFAKGDYLAPVRAALAAVVPGATDRAARRDLYGLLGAGAGEGLRARVRSDPGVLGQTIEVTVSLSSDADLFLKGLVSDVVEAPGVGTATPSGTSGSISVTSTEREFAGELLEVKRAASARARTTRVEADRLRDALARSQGLLVAERANLAAATDADARTRATNEIARYEGEVSSLSAQIATLDASAAADEARFNAPDAPETLDPRLPSLLLTINGGIVKVTQISADRAEGQVMVPLASAAAAAPGTWSLAIVEVPEANRKLGDRELAYLARIEDAGAVRSGFNFGFFTSGDSREADSAGILGAMLGSALTMLVTLVLCLPVGVAAAVYLEEFAPKNRFTQLIEVNINNLAAVPSIVFGLLGLAMFLNFFGLPRSTPIVGGLVLALLVLPTIIIASRAAIRAVPPSIREGALGVGASHQQAVFHHVLPLAMPGILTGTIIGMAHALGETAPLLMIGMIAFIVDPPTGIASPATVLPVQIFLWSDLPEAGFQAKTAAAILVLLVFLFLMNGIAIFLRKRFERRW